MTLFKHRERDDTHGESMELDDEIAMLNVGRVKTNALFNFYVGSRWTSVHVGTHAWQALPP